MKQKYFRGVALYPLEASLRRGSAVAVCLDMGLSADQRRAIRNLSRRADGHFGVQTDGEFSVITYTGRISSGEEARRMLIALTQIVRRITGAQAVIRHMKDARMLNRAINFLPAA